MSSYFQPSCITQGKPRQPMTLTRNAGCVVRPRSLSPMSCQGVVFWHKQSICRDTTQHSKYSFLKLKSYQIIEVIPLWYSPTQPKPSYENEQVTVYWAVPVYADDIEVHANRVDVRIVDKENQIVTLLEMSCPWVENREQKEK